VTGGSWERLCAGDLANLDARGSIFRVDEVDAQLSERCRRLEIHPSGPLWGEGFPSSAGAVLELEKEVAARYTEAAAACTAAGMAQERRSLRIAVRELRCEVEAQAVRIHFRLARGCFENRPAMTRAQPLAVHDAHAAHALLERPDQELAQGELRLGDRHAMQVDLTLHTVIAAAQPAQDRSGDVRAMKRQRFSGQLLGVRAVGVEAFPQYRGPIGAREPRVRTRTRLARGRGMRAQGSDTAHRVPEEPRILALLIRSVIIRQGSHATLRRPCSASSIVSTLPCCAPSPTTSEDPDQ